MITAEQTSALIAAFERGYGPYGVLPNGTVLVPRAHWLIARQRGEVGMLFIGGMN